MNFFLTTLLALATAAAASPLEKRAVQQIFSTPSTSPLAQSGNYTGANNATLPKSDVVTGKSFDRFIQIWLENTDYASAASTPVFQELMKQGQTLTSYYAVTHPSEPNYLAAMSGDFWGLADDTFNYLPENVTTVFDLLDDGKVSWACYQENLPTDGFTGFNWTSQNYITPGAAPYVYYVRKHNPCAFALLPNSSKDRFTRNRNFNDLAADTNADVLPQWIFITPNMVNDGHDTSPAFFSNFTEYFLKPLLNETKFNDNRTLVMLTFDENESYGDENKIMTILLGGALPEENIGKTDDTYMTHYSALASVEANWGLKTLGRGDVNKTMANLLPFVAAAVNYTNTQVDEADRPPTNETGVVSGPLSAQHFVPFYAPADTSVIGPGGQGVMLNSALNKSQVLTVSPAPLNLTAMGQLNPYNTDPFASNTSAAATRKPDSAASLHFSRGGAVGLFLVALGASTLL